jgi:hypothetical protein
MARNPRPKSLCAEFLEEIISAFLIAEFMRDNWHLRTFPEQLEFQNVNKYREAKSYRKTGKALYGL